VPRGDREDVSSEWHGAVVLSRCAGNAAEQFTTHHSYYHPASDRYYPLIERDGKLDQRRHQIGSGGKETNVVEKQIDYVSAPAITRERICIAHRKTN
jgi:hypothetical protein